MMRDPSEIGLNAIEHIRYLVQNIGPRRAGSHSEKRALDYAAEQFIRFGYQPEWIPVPFGESPRPYFQNITAGVILIAAAWLWQIVPIFSMLTPLFLLIIPELERLEIKLRAKKFKTHNIFAFNEGPVENPMVLFCAHIDSAPAMAVDEAFSVRLFASGMRILQRIAILIALLSLAIILGFVLPSAIYLPVGIIGSLVGGWYILVDLINQMDRRKGISPGAIDNASGTGMVLALAEAFAEAPPKRLRVGFLITGGEEPGLYGASVFIQRLLQFKGKVLVFNIDMVGAGDEIQVVTRVGTLLSQDTTKKLNDLLFDIDPKARPVWYSLKSGDFAPFLRTGFDAVSIQTAGSAEAETAYHTRKDTIGLIDIRSLDMTASLISQFMEMLPYSDWAME
jgi:hypothetical protein